MINEQLAHKYCKDDLSKIENYDKAIADSSRTWVIHHRTEIWWNCSAKELIKNECYYHRKACELIFLTQSEHMRLHMKGKTMTTETRQKLSAAMKGKYTGEHHPLYGTTGTMKGKHHSMETLAKLSEANKGVNNPMYGKTLSAETKAKLSESHKGKNNPRYGKHLSEETKMKIREAALRRKARKSKGGTDDSNRVG